MKRRLLVIDDDLLLCEAVRGRLRSEGLEVTAAGTVAEALDTCASGPVDVALLDQRLPDGEGRALCEPILRLNPHCKIIFCTAYPSFENAVEALKAGAHDYLCKPFETEELALTVRRAVERLDLERVERLETYRAAKESEAAVLIGSAGFGATGDLVRRAAETDSPVLISGDTGTGKSLVAKAIHYGGSRQGRPFVNLNCASLPEQLVEAELFGWERGAFTGAIASREGVMEMAEGGTLFLDEIGEMPAHLQAKLLSVLEEKAVKRVGGRVTREVDVRIIAATNADLDARMAEGRFRPDLFYRLNVLRLHLPPLRDRRRDIPALCDHLLRRMARQRPVPRLAEGEQERLMGYQWPGNVRELRNVLERALVLHGDPLRPSELLGPLAAQPSIGAPAAGEDGGDCSLASLEQRHVALALRRHGGNLARTARALGISLSTLKRKTKRFGLRQADPSGSN